MILHFQGYCVSLKQAFAIIPVFIDVELIRHFSCSHPFDDWSFFYFERALAATRSFKFTVFFQKKRSSCGKEIP